MDMAQEICTRMVGRDPMEGTRWANPDAFRCGGVVVGVTCEACGRVTEAYEAYAAAEQEFEARYPHVDFPDGATFASAPVEPVFLCESFDSEGRSLGGFELSSAELASHAAELFVQCSAPLGGRMMVLEYADGSYLSCVPVVL
jgi:hypothetical protein